MTDRIIGVDFDNTLVSYDEVMHRVAVERGLISSDVRKGKWDIRQRVRQSAEGERAWQQLQSIVYGEEIGQARLIEGVRAFFEHCRRAGVPVRIISHKTEFAAWNEAGANLRSAALGWMEAQHFFSDQGLGLSPTDVVFESTRAEKIERIRQLGCTHFIDDLEETFLEPAFPPHVEKILFAPAGARALPPGVRRVNNWQEIDAYFFNTVH
jgi:hypothetical protein